MKKIIMLILLNCFILISACGNSSNIVLVQVVNQYKNSSIELSQDIKYIDLFVDTGNVKVYFWDKKELKVETKNTIRDNKPKDKLEKLLKNFEVNLSEQQKVFKVSAKYIKKNPDKQDYFTDLKLTIPRNIRGINIAQDAGTLIFEDKYEGNINAELDLVNSEVKAIKGKLDLMCNKGNFSLDSGRLLSGSKVIMESGNIDVKTACENMAEYRFETNTGNVKLNFPTNSNILLKSYGTVQNNQFTGIEEDESGDKCITVVAATSMGKISVNGY